jgi:hypothetical protein
MSRHRIAVKRDKELKRVLRSHRIRNVTVMDSPGDNTPSPKSGDSVAPTPPRPSSALSSTFSPVSSVTSKKNARTVHPMCHEERPPAASGIYLLLYRIAIKRHKELIRVLRL